ncbi:MAG: trimethylamine methyltransferase [Spirochaetes bacterium]|nr:MAG: trimethylamine methyltransferase [Spirochaetota bacterium]
MLKEKTNSPGLQADFYKPLSEGNIKKIANEALRILEKSGMLVFSKTAREAFRKAGAEVDESTKLVKMPRSLVEDAIASNPSSITLYSRDGGTDAVLEKNRVHFGTGGTAIYVLDPDTGKRRPSNINDVILCAQLTEALENIHVFTINVFPHEVKNQDDIDINRFFYSIDNTNKHVMGGVYSLEGCKKVVKMAEMIAGSEQKLREKPFVSFITLIISPFKIDDNYGEISCYLAEKELPVVVPTEPICGTTSPVTLAGNILVHVVETLGGIAMVQCVKKGAPGIFGSVGSITNLKTMDHVGGAIERAMIHAAVSQMAQYFGLPLYSTAGTTDAQEVDIQSAYESAMSSLLVSLSGANYIHDIAGLMEADLTVSFEKMIVDNEILGMCRRVMKGIEVNDDTLAADLIIEKGPGENYIAEEHTVKHMRDEFYTPRISIREKRDAVKDEKTAMENARNFLDELRTREKPSLLPPEVRDSILKTFPEIIKT